MEKLKPCPFCGGKANFFSKTFSVKGTYRGWEFGVYCTRCNITSPRTDYRLGVDFGSHGELIVANDDRQKALEEWNRRVNE